MDAAAPRTSECPVRAPLVAVVVVAFGPAARTLACVASIAATDWPRERLRIVVVDNGSEVGLDGALAALHPAARYVRSERNVGYAAACRRGVRELAGPDVFALVNNDVVVDPSWLRPLVRALDGEGVGTASPKVLLARRYAEVELSVPEARTPPHDARCLGVQLSGVRCGRVGRLEEVLAGGGLWGWEDDPMTVGGRFAWTSGRASLQVPVEEAGALDLRLSCGLGPRQVDVSVAGGRRSVEVGVRPRWFRVGEVTPCDLVDSAGTVLHDDGTTGDRGHLHVDDGRFDRDDEVFGWSGAAVAVSRRYLEDVGDPDDRYFLYFEDTDLAWRGRLRGWRSMYVARSVVRHEHSATTSGAPALVEHLARRNRLILLTKVAPARLAVASARQLVVDVVLALWRDAARPLARGGRPNLLHTVRLVRVLAAVIQLLPHALVHRRRIRREATVSVADVMRWAVRDGPAGSP